MPLKHKVSKYVCLQLPSDLCVDSRGTRLVYLTVEIARRILNDQVAQICQKPDFHIFASQT